MIQLSFWVVLCLIKHQGSYVILQVWSLQNQNDAKRWDLEWKLEGLFPVDLQSYAVHPDQWTLVSFSPLGIMGKGLHVPYEYHKAKHKPIIIGTQI